MRSCEYLKVPRTEDRKTKTLCLRNIRFFKQGKEIPNNSKLCLEAHIVSITFEDQKNREKFDTVNLHRSNDKLLCPVRSWGNTTLRIHSYPGSTMDTQVNTFSANNKIYHFSSQDVIKLLRDGGVKNFGEDTLGFTAEEVGTHSIRAGGAMAMYLAGIVPFTIQIIGRWKSTSFLEYIRKQVQQFTENISDQMVREEHFTHIPSHQIPSSTFTRLGEKVENEDSDKTITSSMRDMNLGEQ